MSTIAKTIEWQLRVHDAGTNTPTDLTVDFSLTAILSGPPEWGFTTIRPSRGEILHAPWKFRVVDLNEAITGNLADPTTRRLDLMGRLVEIRSDENGAGYQRVDIGRLSNLSVSNDQAEYNLEVSDEMWVLRDRALFEFADTTQLYPPGILHPWGTNDRATAGVAEGTVIGTQSGDTLIRVQHYFPLSDSILSWISGDAIEHTDSVIPGARFTHTRVLVDGVSHEVRGFAKDYGDEHWKQPGKEEDGSTFYVWVKGSVPGSPANVGATNKPFYAIRVVAPTAPPSDTLPLHVGVNDLAHRFGVAIGSNLWVVAKAILDHLGLRYNAAALQLLIDDAHYVPASWRITSPVKNAEAWFRSELFKAQQALPFRDIDGAIELRTTRPPDAFTGSAAFADLANSFVFDVGNTTTAPHFHSETRSIINKAIYEYELYSGVALFDVRSGTANSPGALGAGLREDIEDFPADALRVEKKTFPVEHDNIDILGEHSETFSLRGQRSPPGFLQINLTNLPANPPQTKNTLGIELYGLFHAQDIFGVFGDGPVRWKWGSHRWKQDGTGRTPMDDVQEGDYVKLSVSTIPNAEINQRGGVRIVQVLTKQVRPDGINWVALDAGPDLQPIATPTLALSAGPNPLHDVNATLSGIPAGATATLEIGLHSGGTEFDRKVVLLGNGVHTIGQLPSGTVVRVRATAVAPLRVRSDHTATQSITTTSLAAPTISLVTINGTAALGTFVNNEPNYEVAPLFRLTSPGTDPWEEDQAQPLPPTSTFYTWHLPLQSTGYTVGLRVVDPYGGSSALATSAVTTGLYLILPVPRRLRARQGRGPDDTAANIPPGSQTLGWGNELGWSPSDLTARTQIQLSQASDFASIEQDLQVLEGADRAFVFVAPDNVVRYYRIRHVRRGHTDSSWSSTISVKTTALLPFQVPDTFAAGFAFLDALPNGDVELNLGSAGDTDTDRVYWGIAVNPVGDVYPVVDATSPVVLSTALPYQAAPDDPGNPGNPFTVTDGDIALLTARFWNSISGFGQETRFKLRVPISAITDCQPTLDEDTGDLNLYPGRTTAALSVKYVIRTDRDPTLAETQAGTVTTADELLAIHTFTSNDEVAYVGVLAYSANDGTGTEGPLRLRRHTFRTGNDGPTVTHHPYQPAANPDFVGVRIIGRDDGATVAVFYRTFDNNVTEDPRLGGTPPAFSTTGQVADPARAEVEFLRPAEGSVDKVVEYYAEDAAGLRTHPPTRAARVYIDANEIPRGFFQVIVESNGTCWVRPQFLDDDTKSCRFRVAVGDTSAEGFVDPAFAVAADEYTASVSGARVAITQTLVDSDDVLYVSGWFFRTTSEVAATQSASLPRSPKMRGSGGFLSTGAVTVEEQVGQNGSLEGTLAIVVGDPLNEVDTVHFRTSSGFLADFTVPGGAGWTLSSAGTTWTVPLTEKHLSYIGYAVTLLNGAVISAVITYDQDLIPNFTSTQLAVEDDGTVTITYSLDNDGASIRQRGQAGSFPAGDGTGWDLTAGRTGQVKVHDGAGDLVLATGEAAHVALYAYSGGGGTGVKSIRHEFISSTRKSDTGVQGGNWLTLSNWIVRSAASADTIGLEISIDFHVAVGPTTQSMRVEVYEDGINVHGYNFNISADGRHTMREANGTATFVGNFDSFYEARCTPYDATGGAAGAGTSGATRIINSDGVQLSASEGLTNLADDTGNAGVADLVNVVGALGLAATPTTAGAIDLGFSSDTVHPNPTGNSLTPDIANGPHQSVTANGHFTLNAPAAAFLKKHGMMIIKIDLGGTWTLTLDTVYQAGVGTAAKAVGVCYVSFFYFDTDEFITSIHSDTNGGGV